MQIIKALINIPSVLTICFICLSCTSKAKFADYDKQLDEIRSEVRTIRLLTDQMKNEVINMKTSVGIMNEYVDKQSKDIDTARLKQKELSETIDSIKQAVVKLESETIPAKKAEIAENIPENMVFKRPDGVTVIQPLKDGGKQRTIKYSEALNVNSGFGYAVKDGVILWQSPTKQSEVVEVLLAWQQVMIISSTTNDGINWLKVKTDDYSGYVNSKFIMVSEEKIASEKPVEVKPLPEKKILCVTSDNGLRIRISPDKKAETLGLVKFNDRVEVLSENGEWSEVIAAGTKGFVLAPFLKECK